MSTDFADAMPPGLAPYRNALETRLEALEHGQVTYEAKTDVRFKTLEREYVEGRESLERKVDMILGAVKTLADGQTEHLANHKAEQRYRDEQAKKAEEQDRVHSSRIRDLESESARKTKVIELQGVEIQAHGSLLNRFARTPHGKAALAGGSGLSLLAVIEILAKALAHSSVIDAALKYLTP